MDDARRLILLGRNGELLETTIQAALNRLAARAVRQFPALKDDVALVEVLEEAGRRIVARQERAGPLANLHGYAWVTVRSVATSFMRRGAARLIQKTLEPQASAELLTSRPAESFTPANIEQQILLREVLSKLTSEERLICVWKQAGFSSQDISMRTGRSVPAVDTVFSRAKDRLRRLLGVAPL
jgi:DNA-directed RNA polymerase specialized sigma24 family protein